MIRSKRNIRCLAGPLGLAAALLGLGAAPAGAAPQLGVVLERDEAVVAHNDERVDYTVNISNVAKTDSGDQLSCDPGTWSGSSPAFAFSWLRNGAPIAGAEGATYTLQPVDDGKVVQCRVKATNTVEDVAGGFSGATDLATGLVVDPVPATAPPTKAGTIPQPQASGPLDGTAARELTCSAGNWSGAPTSYTYRWYRNGNPFGAADGPTSATSSKLTLAPADQTPPAAFQCGVTATNPGGSREAVSVSRLTTPEPDPAAPANDGDPSLSGSDATSGTVSLELELPAGEETFVFKLEGGGIGVDCESLPASGIAPAKVLCDFPNSLKPGESYPPLTVVTGLDPNAPDQAVARATVSGGGAVPVSAVDEFTFAPAIPFEILTFETAVFDQDGNIDTRAGGHPFSALANFAFSTRRRLGAQPNGTQGRSVIGHVKRVLTDAPRGFIGNARATPELCPSVLDVAAPVSTCPAASVVGGVEAVGFGDAVLGNVPIYALEPEFGVPAEFAFRVVTTLIIFTPQLRADDGYAVRFVAAPIPESIDITSTKVTVCGFGGKAQGNIFQGCKKASDPDANPIPLVTNPTRCAGAPPVATTRINTWEEPERFVSKESVQPPMTDCEEVKFEPEMEEMRPTSHRADSPTGLDVNLTMPSEGIEDTEGISQAHMRRARVTFPQGMTINGSAGQGLGACSAAQVKLKTNLPIECPDSSKIGTMEIESPIIETTLQGAIYVAKQGDIGGALVGFYAVFESKQDGVIIKIPGRVTLDERTGQMTVTFDENPEAPFTSARVHFAEGPRSVLMTPPKCGKYVIKSELSPWTAVDPANPTATETVTDTNAFEITEGPGGSPCPSDKLEPKLSAGATSPAAGETSPFVFSLSREDGTQRFSSLSMDLPKGLTAYLAGVPYCPDSVLASIPRAAGAGQGQLEHPSCPAASQVGTASAGSGAGSNPFYADTGKVYLAGPYKGGPASLVVVAPVVAGPLDLGNVVVRNAIRLDPETAQVSVMSDPIPTILHGILTNIRDVRVTIDRPHFTLNPTSCEEKSIEANIHGEMGASAQVSNRFQVGGCERLAFKPKVSTRLFGPTGRGGHPGLRGILSARQGHANVKRVAVTVPRSEFLDQAHIRTICTRVQFAARACPKGSIYGRVTAVTPLLDYPVSGPVYLRSSDNELPDLVAVVRGPEYQPIEAVVVGRVDSIRGQIRATFENIPDVPLSKVILRMQGGKKGLLVNSRDICQRKFRIHLKMEGHNGDRLSGRPPLRNGKCGKGPNGKRRGHGRGSGGPS